MLLISLLKTYNLYDIIFAYYQKGENMNENYFFKNFKNNIAENKKRFDEKTANSGAHSKQNGAFQNIIGYIVAFFSAIGAFILSLYKKLSLLAKILIGSATLLLVAAIILITALSPSNKSVSKSNSKEQGESTKSVLDIFHPNKKSENKKKSPSKSPKSVSKEYIKHIAVFDYSSVENTELIPTKTIFEKIVSSDFGSYIQRNIELQVADFDSNIRVTINGVKQNEIIESDQAYIKDFLSYFGTSVPKNELKTGKWVTVSYTITGDTGSIVNDDTQLFLINHEHKNKSSWKVIQKEYVDDFIVRSNMINQEMNNFSDNADN